MIEVKINEKIENRLSFINDKIKAELDNDNDRKIFVVVPDQFNFSMQKCILERLNTNVISQIEVLDFRRLIYRIFEEVNYFKEGIGDIERLSIITNIVNDKKDELKFFGVYNITDKIIIEINNILKLINKNVIDILDMKKFKDDKDSILSNKIHDISLIYDEFNTKLISMSCDIDTITPLKNVINDCKVLDNASIYLSEFYNFTNEQIEILNILNNRGLKITLLMQANDKYAENENGLFYPIKYILEKMNISESNVDYLKDNYKKEKDFEILENVFKNNSKFNEETLDNITINDYTSKDKELFNVCLYIKDLINNGYRYKDINVVFKKYSNYELKLKEYFEIFDIPYFSEEKKLIINSNVIRSIMKMLDMINNGYNNEKVLSFIKEDVFNNINDKDIYEFDNYVLKNGIEYFDTLKKHFDKEMKGENKSSKKEKCDLNKVEKVFGFIESIKKNFDFKNDSLESINKRIIDFLVKNIDEEYVNDSQKEIEKFYDTIEKWSNCDTNKYSVSEYLDRLKVLLEDVSVSKLNETLDQVNVYDSKRVNFLETKILILCGFSNISQEQGKLTNLFSEKENEKLLESNIEFNKKFKNQILEEKFLFFNMIEKVKEKLMINYTKFEDDQEVMIGNEFSKLIDSVKQVGKNVFKEDYIIDKLLPTDESIIKYIYININEFEIKKDLIKKCMVKISNKDLINELFDYRKFEEVQIEDKHDVLELSFSAIEKYVDCPFSYFMQYKLGVKEREEMEYDAATVGNIAHELFEKFFNKVANEEIKTKNMSEDDIKKNVDDILQNEVDVDYLKDDKNEATFNRYKEVLYRNVINFVTQINNGEFVVKYNELEFGKDKNVLGIEFNANDGTKIYLGGKIDRVDLIEDDDDIYIKVIDYKTGIKNFKVEEVLQGKNMQLVIYLKVLLDKYKKENKNPIPAGVFLAKVNKSFKKDDEYSLLDNKLDGIYSDQEAILAKLDKDYKDSKILQVAFEEDSGNMTKTSMKKAYSKEAFVQLTDNCLDVTKNISNNIVSGKMDVKRSSDSKSYCSYCPYKNICKNVE